MIYVKTVDDMRQDWCGAICRALEVQDVPVSAVSLCIYGLVGRRLCSSGTVGVFDVVPLLLSPCRLCWQAQPEGAPYWYLNCWDFLPAEVVYFSGNINHGPQPRGFRGEF